MSDNGLAPCGKRSGNSQTSEQQEVRSDMNQNSPMVSGQDIHEHNPGVQLNDAIHR